MLPKRRSITPTDLPLGRSFDVTLILECVTGAKRGCENSSEGPGAKADGMFGRSLRTFAVAILA